jgi:hypothetical protein
LHTVVRHGEQFCCMDVDELIAEISGQVGAYQ